MTATEFANAQELANLASQLDEISRKILIAFGNGIVAGKKISEEEHDGKR